MFKRSRYTMAAAMAGLLAASLAHADPAPAPTPVQPRATEFSPGALPGVGSTYNRPLMSALDEAGIGQTFQAARINIFGYVEGSYTWNFDTPAKDLNLGRVFDVEHNKALINQLDLSVERKVDLQSGQFDVGGRVDFLYGGDSRFIHSNGFFDGANFFHGPEYQFDIPQLYVDLGIPVGNGLRVRAGKFLFFKQIDPNASVFYSHSYIFGGALPFTNTGITAFYPLSTNLSVEGGISRGWDQTLKDDNGAIDALGRVRYTISDQTDLTAGAIFGPELPGDNSHYRATIDAALSHQLNERTTLLVDAVYGYQAMPSGTTAAMWYGVAGYGVYQLSDYLALGLRGEWYRDEEGFTTGLINPLTGAPVGQNLFEATVGATITPFPNNDIGRNLKIRPELRYDYATGRYFDGASKHDQTTIAVDAIFNF